VNSFNDIDDTSNTENTK